MASSSLSVAPYKEYEVFISFRGSDVRQGFLSHLYKALLDQGIEAFVDDQLDRGEEISESLLEKIEQSRIAIVIFSQNYADSKWCLEELLKIVECKNTAGQIVIPVFYGVDPSHVQNLTGSYGDAMAKHRRNGESLVEEWGSALKDTACLSGIVFSHYKDESELTKAIVEETLKILERLCPSASDRNDRLIGIESRVGEVKLLLCGSEHVSVVGIWGVGGIGKTTVAQATFDEVRSQFDHQCFIGIVREKSDTFTTDAVRNEVVSKLFGTSDSNMSRKRLSRKKVILVFDDVSDFDQIKLIMRYRDDVGPWSRIIVTSRDRHLLEYLDAKIYAVKELDWHEALQLFYLNAFKKKVPQEGYLELSERAVKYAQGLPLALEVLGSNLFQRSAEEWQDELEKLKGTSDQKIQKILRRSYKGLSGVEKEIFLDIACFFKGRIRDEVERLLDAPGSKIGISRLAEKALISVSFGRIEMHDLIEQMARDIICEKESGERRWLWDPEDIHFLLTREMGTEAVKGIILDMSKIENIYLRRTAFQKLRKLRYLNFYSFKGVSAQLYAPQGLEYLPRGLRYLHWDRYPSKSLPIVAEKLVELLISNSQLEELWNGVQNLPNLKKLDLSRSGKLIRVPDLSTASKLEELRLERCESLVEIPSSLKSLSKLAQLWLGHCSRLRSLPDDICKLENLWVLDVSYCGNLHGLPQNFGNLNSLVKLLARGSGIKELPDSVCNLNVIRLDVRYCANLHQLPQNFGNLQSLKVLEAGRSGIKELPDSVCNLKACTQLDVTYCVNLHQLPQNLGDLQSLQFIRASGSGMEELPDSVCNLKDCIELDVRGCANLHQLPQNLGDLQSLQFIRVSGSGMEELPDSVCNLKDCIELDVSGCANLHQLPQNLGDLRSLEFIRARGSDIKELPDSICNLKACTELDVSGCVNLHQLPQNLGDLRSLKFIRASGSGIKELPDSICNLKDCTELDVRCCANLHQLPQNLGDLRSLKFIRAGGSGIKELPDSVCNLKACKELDVNGCANLHQLPKNLGDLQSLKRLQAVGSAIKELPDSVCNLKGCKELDVSDCENLHQLPQNLGELRSLKIIRAVGSGIKELPDSICNLKACTELDVSYCANLHQLPQNIGNLQSLEVLVARGSGMKEIPSSITKLTKLGTLALDGSEGVILPPLTGSFPHLWDIALTNMGMSEFPIDLCSMTSLKWLDLSGNHFERIPESIQHLLELNKLRLDYCKELKYLPESLKLLPWLNFLQMEGCTSLDQNQFSNIMNHFAVEYIKGRREHMAMGCHPGSEVPEKMTYKNEHGSSLSFSFKLLQHIPNHKLEFSACVVSDGARNVCGIRVKFMNEYRPGYSCSYGFGGGSGLNWMTVKWEHKPAEFGREFVVKGREYAVEFQFKGEEGVTKCGVIPLFEHQTVE